MALGKDLRERIVAAVEAGESHRAVAKRFLVNRHTVDDYMRRHRSGQGLKPKSPPGGKRTIAPQLQEQLREQLEEYPDATLKEHCELWLQRSGIRVSITTMHRTWLRMGITRKKNSMRHGTR